MTRAGTWICGLVAVLWLPGCTGTPGDGGPLPLTKVRTERTWLKDGHGRYVTLHGINVSGSTKIPAKVGDVPLFDANGGTAAIFDPYVKGKPSYLGKPFPGYPVPLADIAGHADRELRKLRDAGFDSIRLLLNWEGIEPEQKGVYDADYLASIRTVVETANRYGIYVVLDMHQDSFTRHLGAQHNEYPDGAEGDDTANMLGGLFPPYTHIVRGEGAPLWVIKPCLYEKDFDSPHWFAPKILSNLDFETLCSVLGAYKMVTQKNLLEGAIGTAVEGYCNENDRDGFCLATEAFKSDIPGWADPLVKHLCQGGEGFAIHENGGSIPFTDWSVVMALSLEVQRSYTCFLAGNSVFPDLTVQECQDDPCADSIDEKLRPKDCDPCRAPRAPTPVANCPAEKLVEVNIQDWLQSAYAGTWRQVACQVRGLPNVAGYDVMNEPNGDYIYQTAVAILVGTGLTDEARLVLNALLGKADGERLHKVLTGLRLFPPIPAMPQPSGATNCGSRADAAKQGCTDAGGADCTASYQLELKTCLAEAKLAVDEYAKANAAWKAEREAVLKEWGLDRMDPFAAVNLMFAFEWSFLRPLYGRIGRVVQEVDPEAVVWIEASLGGSNVSLSGDGSMTRPEGVKQVVFEPHWYWDIFQYTGINQPPRCYEPEEVRWNDYSPEISAGTALANSSLGHLPVVFGEFGTFFNFCSTEKDPAVKAMGIEFSKQVLDNNYEAFEKLGLSRMQWVYTPENSDAWGDWWNHENFSIQGPDRKWRGWEAWMRPYARALAGKPISSHFWSDLHYFDPDKGIVPPRREYEVRYGGKETEAPTEIVVPDLQYPDGFYVWLSDGHAYYDPESRVLSHFPANDQPGAEHWVRILPPLPNRVNEGWQYFIQGDRVLTGN